MVKNKAEARGDRGMVLMSSLAILFVLMVIGIGIRTMLQNDYRVLANLRGGIEAFYLSVAGMEWSKSEIAGATDFPPALTNQTGKFGTGEFAVAFVSSTLSSPFAAKLVVRSIGTKGASQHVLQAGLTKAYDLSDAALGLRGNGALVNLSGDSIFISGADHDPSNGSTDSNTSGRRAISTSDDKLLGLVQQALGEPPRIGVLDVADGIPATATSGYLPMGFVAQLASQLCASPDAIVHAVPGGGSLAIGNETWGSAAVPQLRCVEGLSIPGDSVSMADIAGAGIIVVRDADLVLVGAFRWEGLVIVTGNDVSLKATGTSAKEVFGSVVINESGTPALSKALLDVDGNFRILFSRKALSRAEPFIPTGALNSAYAALPCVISQDYWRAVTP